MRRGLDDAPLEECDVANEVEQHVGEFGLVEVGEARHLAADLRHKCIQTVVALS